MQDGLLPLARHRRKGTAATGSPALVSDTAPFPATSRCCAFGDSPVRQFPQSGLPGRKDRGLAISFTGHDAQPKTVDSPVSPKVTVDDDPPRQKGLLKRYKPNYSILNLSQSSNPPRECWGARFSKEDRADKFLRADTAFINEYGRRDKKRPIYKV